MSTSVPVGFVASRIAQSRKRIRHSEQGNRRMCPHCDQSLCLKTFKKHERLYRKDDGSWVTEADTQDIDNGKSKLLNY